MDGIDAGAERWWRKFSRQVNDGHMYTGSRPWPDEVKVAILGNYLGGMAEDWYDEERSSLISMSFQEVGDALVKRFRTKRTDKQVMTEICNMKKKPTEPYEQFANRIKRTASLLTDGARAPHNARIVLQTFCERAYPAKQESLEHAIDVEAEDPLRELERAIMHLTKLADSDGAMDASHKRSPPGTFREWPSSKRQKTAGGTAHMAATTKSQGKMIERKEKPARRATSQASESNRFANFTCTICIDAGLPGRGHNAKYHRRHPELFENKDDQAQGRSDAMTEREHSA